MEWGIVLSVIVGLAIFLLAIATIGAMLVWLMLSKVKKGTQSGSSKKFSFPCAAFFGGKAEAPTK
jgi:hypothetical protein